MKKLLLTLSLTLFTLIAFASTKTAIFAGGCFWCVQSDFDKLPGVISTSAGYDGGTQANPNYEKVSSGTTNYAESLKVVYDPKKVSYSQLVRYFFEHIDPTVKDAQFCDHGKQYRSAIFYQNAQQKYDATHILAQVKKLFPHVYTQIAPSTTFYDAETYHQDYYKKNPARYKYYRWACGRDSRVQQLWHDKTL